MYVGQAGCRRWEIDQWVWLSPAKALNKRRIQHCGDNPLEFDQAIRKLGREDFEWWIAATAHSQSELNRLEAHIISLFRSTDPEFGFNVKPSAESHAWDTKQKIGRGNRGKRRSEEFKAECRERTLRQFSSEEARKAASDSAKARFADPDYFAAHKAAQNSPEVRAKRQGEANIKAKVTTEQVREIRTLADQFTRQELAVKFALTKSTVSKIVLRKTWAHVA